MPATLALAEVMKTFFVVPEVVVPVGRACSAREDDYERCVSRGANSALLLSTKRGVNLVATVVERSHLKG